MHYNRSRGGTGAAATHSNTKFEIPSSSIGETSGTVSGHLYASSTSPQHSQRQQQQLQSRVFSCIPASPPLNESTSSAAQYTRVKLDLSPKYTAAREELLRDACFPDLRDASSGDLEHPDEMQKKDPLATQIWKLYSKAKTQLPNQERMENLTWRMMAMNLKRKEREQARWV